jgi:hypothetical protein
LRKPTQYSVCFTAARSSAAELEWGRVDEMKTMRCVVNTQRPSSYRGALSFLAWALTRQPALIPTGDRGRTAAPVIESDAVCVGEDAFVGIELDRERLERHIERSKPVHTRIRTERTESSL